MQPETALDAFTRILRETNDARQRAIETRDPADEWYADALASLIGPRVELAAFCEQARARLAERLGKP